jgi:hypothetical protein
VWNLRLGQPSVLFSECLADERLRSETEAPRVHRTRMGSLSERYAQDSLSVKTPSENARGRVGPKRSIGPREPLSLNLASAAGATPRSARHSRPENMDKRVRSPARMPPRQKQPKIGSQNLAGQWVRSESSDPLAPKTKGGPCNGRYAREPARNKNLRQKYRTRVQFTFTLTDVE